MAKQLEADRKERIATARRWRASFANSGAFDCLMEILTLLKWRGILETEADIARHNAAEEIIAFFGDNEEGFGWTRDRIADQLRSATGIRSNPIEMKEKTKDARRNTVGK